MKKSVTKFVPKELADKAKLYEQRNELYGDTYKQLGSVLEQIFPDGIELTTPEDQNRYAILSTMVSKVVRYAANWERGGHDDSLDDICVYAMMLKELDNV